MPPNGWTALQGAARQREQWQFAAYRNASAASWRTAPHSHPPRRVRSWPLVVSIGLPCVAGKIVDRGERDNSSEYATGSGGRSLTPPGSADRPQREVGDDGNGRLRPPKRTAPAPTALAKSRLV